MGMTCWLADVLDFLRTQKRLSSTARRSKLARQWNPSRRGHLEFRVLAPGLGVSVRISGLGHLGFRILGHGWGFSGRGSGLGLIGLGFPAF